MSEGHQNHSEDEPNIPEQQAEPILENVEMPESFVEPEGKSGKWGEPVENKELGISYREKVIELPKHRQEETGVKQIRRREVLTYPKEFYVTSENNHSSYYRPGSYYSSDSKFDGVYKFLTDGRYKAHDVLNHRMNLEAGEEKNRKNLDDFKRENLYFQNIMPRRTYGSAMRNFFVYKLDSETNRIRRRTDRPDLLDFNAADGEDFTGEVAISGLYCTPGSRINDGAHPIINGPIFVFSRNNASFIEYAESVCANEDCRLMMDDRRISNVALEIFLSDEEFKQEKDSEYRIPSIRYPGIKPLKWCNAELAIIPTKRNLNVLFFETGDENKTEQEKT